MTAKTSVQPEVAPNSLVCESDSELLRRFVSAREEDAFHELVSRHGPLVMGVCVRVLGHWEDAEDAFQATFIVLAKRANRVRKRTSLAAWLYGVAYRVSVDLARKRQRAERSLVSEPMHSDDPFTRMEYEFDRQVVDEELQALPPRYRTPLVLFYLGGKTSKEIAEQLGCSQGTVDGQLKRGRQELRVRLTRRGVAMAGLLSVISVSAEHAIAAVSPTLVSSTASIGVASASGSLPVDATLAESMQLATKEILRMSLMKPIATTLGFTLVLGLGVVCVNGFEGPGGGTAVAGLNTAIASQETTAEASAGSVTMAQAQPESPASAADPASSPSTIRQDVSKQPLDPASGPDRRVRSGIGGWGSSGGLGGGGLGGGLPRRSGSTSNQTGRSSNEDLTSTAPETGLKMQMKTSEQTRAAHAKIMTALAGLCEPIQGGDSLKSMLNFIAEVHNFPIVADHRMLATAGLNSLEDVTVNEDLSLSNLPLQNAMDILFEQTDSDEPLDYILADGVMKITTRKAADVYRESRVYDLSRLTTADVQIEDLLTAISSTIDFSDKDDSDIMQLGKRLLVRHNQRSHRKVADLLSQLKVTVGGATPPAP